MKTTGAHTFGDKTNFHLFESWLRRHTKAAQMVSGETMNAIMTITAANWSRPGRAVRARYINHALFRVSQEGIVILQGVTMIEQTVHITKYQNRKLYDTELARYVHFEDLSKTLKEGKSIQVTDKHSGIDITDRTLTELIAQNEAAAKSSTLPMGFMTRVLEAGSLTAYAHQLEGRLQ